MCLQNANPFTLRKSQNLGNNHNDLVSYLNMNSNIYPINYKYNYLKFKTYQLKFYLHNYLNHNQLNFVHISDDKLSLIF